VYKKDTKNKVVDALSRKEGHLSQLHSLQASISALSKLVPQCIRDISSSYKDDPWISSLMATIQNTTFTNLKLTFHQGILR
jgi:translation initiation factor 2B subunit (eIF-2B alpha/beta/delta family)